MKPSQTIDTIGTCPSQASGKDSQQLKMFPPLLLQSEWSGPQKKLFLVEISGNTQPLGPGGKLPLLSLARASVTLPKNCLHQPPNKINEKLRLATLTTAVFCDTNETALFCHIRRMNNNYYTLCICLPSWEKRLPYPPFE